jgi:type IV secretion system protein VirB10
MDRWRLSRDHANLTVTRQIIRGVRQEEGSMVYRRDSQAAPPPPPVETPRELPPPRPAPVMTPAPQPALQPAPAPLPPAALARREEPAPFEAVIRAGTHIPLTFRNTVDTKHSHEGDRIYLQTAFPVAQDGRTILPRGTFVTGAVTQIKQPGHLGKGELFLRFDTLTLPNGTTRDLRSRLGSGDEGKVAGQPDRGADARKVGGAAGTGASVGVITGSAAGHAGMGAGIGGAAAGIASVLLSRGADARLPQGTTVDMVLDRDLRFRSDELR